MGYSRSIVETLKSIADIFKTFFFHFFEFAAKNGSYYEYMHATKATIQGFSKYQNPQKNGGSGVSYILVWDDVIPHFYNKY